MTAIALAAALLALLIALLALSRASAAKRAAEEEGLQARRRAENGLAELEQRAELLRQMVATLAGGGTLTREMVLEGRLWRDVDNSEAQRSLAAGARLLDVRTPQETAGGIIPGALLIPVDQLEQRLREVPKDKELLVYCAGGGRSAAACELLAMQGWSGLMNLAGGFGGWNGPRAKP